MRRELPNEPVRMRGHAQQDIFKVDVGREVNQMAALHERVEQRRAARALETPREEPVLGVIEVLR